MYRFLFVVFTLIILSSCSSSVKTFTGEVLEVKDKMVIVECTKLRPPQGDDVGYSCPVKITDKTTLLNENDEQIKSNILVEELIVEVTLTSKTET